MPRGSKPGEYRGGRKKGTPNKHKSSFRTELRAYCAKLGVDPHQFMADMIADNTEIVYGIDVEGNPITGPAVRPELKLSAAKELAQYIEPKLKAMDIEVSGNAEKPLVVTIRRAR